MKYSQLLYLVLILSITGCAQITETVKVVWGSSTRALENARVDAITKTYQCSFDECFDAVLSLERTVKTYIVNPDGEANDDGEEEETENEKTERIKKVVSSGMFDVFIKNRKKQHLVVMGIYGNVDTTEVGIFFSQPDTTTVKLEISSLSSNAKRNVAQAVFDELDTQFSAAN